VSSAHDSTATVEPDTPTIGTVLRARWPSILGVVMIAATSFDGVDVYVVALVTLIAALCYLAAAATDRPRGAWVAFAASFAIVPLGIITRIDLGIPLLGIGLALVAYGLITLPRAKWSELAIQTGGVAAFAAIGFIALNLGPVAAGHVAALGIIGHGVWDVIHHRRDKVAVRSFTEFCAVLDFGLGTLLLVVTWIAILA
jgi:hypothetical protein